jgi:hypothetical protein
MSPTLLCFGFGYTARVVADRLLRAGWAVLGTSRDPGRGRTDPVQFHRFDRHHPLPPEALARVTHILTSIPPDELGDPVLDLHGCDLRGMSDLRWAGWLGTTGVYGDRGGAWVDEDTPLEPTLARADRRARAEQAWLGSGLPVHIFRLAGIYGPGRNAFVNLRQGTARRIVKPGQVFSRIHVEDIATVLEASMARPDPGRIYNVCDDEPAPPQDVVTYAAALMGVPAPPEQPWDRAELSPMARSFYRDNRRVRNDRIRQELGVRLAFPSFREGLHALLPVDGR